jgi:hypothetical protein
MSLPAAQFPSDPSCTRQQQAFDRLEPEIRALAANADLWHINVDIQHAVTTVLGVVPKVRSLRPALAATLPTFDLALLDKLEDHAFALAHAHAVYRAAVKPVDEVPALAAETTAVRDALLSDATALARRGLLDEGRVGKLHSPNGYKNIAFDVLGLVSLFREAWSRIENKTAVEPHELERAERMAKRLLKAVGVRQEANVAVDAAAGVRHRAFTLFMRAYDEVRRAVQYLRWHEGDAERIAPSLYAGRGSGRRKHVRSAAPSEPASA